jgi:hypothetical protein
MRTGERPKYEPLRRYLAAQPGETVTLTLTFAELEGLIGASLPTSAEQRSWWVNRTDGGLPQMRAWQRAGWRVSTVGLRSVPRAVTFARRWVEPTDGGACARP